MNDINNRKILRVPVMIVDGKLKYIYGDELPLKNGTVGDLIIDEIAITDNNFKSLLKRKSAYKILDVDSELLVALTIKPGFKLDKKLIEHLKKINSQDIILGTPYYHTLRSSDTQFVKIQINGPTDKQKKTSPAELGGIWLHLEGLQPKNLTTSTVKLPDEVSSEPAISLNHAFTLLSDKYEPWRKSHTGNIYSRILYQETNKKWYPLDVLRNAAIAKDEHQIIKERWAEISKELNIHTDK